MLKELINLHTETKKAESLDNLYDVYVKLTNIYDTEELVFKIWQHDLLECINDCIATEQKLDALVFFCNNGYYPY